MTGKPFFFLFAACIVGCSETDGEPPMLVDMGHREFDVTLVSSGEFGFDGGLEFDARTHDAGDSVSIVDMGVQEDASPMDMERDTGLSTCNAELCGGDVLGDYLLDGICEGGYQRTVELPDSVECSLPAMETVRIDASGSARFREDGRYESATILDIDFALEVPNECLQGSATCALFQLSFLGSPETQDWICEQASMNSPCICSGSRREIDTASGTFTLDGDYLSVTPIEAQTDSPNRSAELKGRFGVCANEQGVVLVRPADEDIPADLTLQYTLSAQN